MAVRRATKKTTDKAPAAKPAAAKAPKKTEPVDPVKATVNTGVKKIVEHFGLDNQKSNYKAMRALAYQAFIESIDEGEFDGLVERAIDNAGELPSGWTLTTTPKKSKPVVEDIEEELDEDEAEEVEEDNDLKDEPEEDEAEEPAQESLDFDEEEEEEPVKPVKRARRTPRRAAKK